MVKDSYDEALFEGLFQKTVVSRFDSELRSSDGGASLLAAVASAVTQMRPVAVTQNVASEELP